MYSRTTKFITWTIILLGVFASVFPFYWMLVMSSVSNKEVFQRPPVFLPGDQLWTNIKLVIEKTNFFNAIKNTIFVAVVSTVATLFFSSLAGFAFAKLRFKGKDLLFSILLLTMVIPGQINIIPSFYLMDKLGWVGSYKALIIPGMAGAFGIFWMKQFCEKAIPTSLIESAELEGASIFYIYRKIIVPLIRPAMAFLALNSFMGSWNDYMWPLIILNDEKKYTLMLALTSLKGLYTTNYPLVITGTLLATIPLIVLFIFFSKELMDGLGDGALK